METPRIATIGLLLSVILIAWPVMGEPAGRPQGPSAGGSASVLLQEGLYAEEIEGDLDGAIKIYERVLVEAKDIEQAAAQATYRIGICFLKKGDKAKAAEYFGKLISEHPEQKAFVARAQEQLTKLGIGQLGSTNLVGGKANLFEQLYYEVIQAIAGKYGSISAEAAAKDIYSNSHIYFVTSDWVLLKAGMGYYRNGSGQPQTGRIRLSGTSYPDQTLYDVAGRQMNIEIVQDKVRQGFYHIYWTPSEALPPGQMFYYGWCIDDSKQLRPAPGTGHYVLEMQNKFGSRVRETFFLVLPKATTITTRSEDFTGKDTVGDCDIYYWSKEVPQNTNNVVNVRLTGPVLSAPKEVTLPIILHSRADIDLDVEPDKYVAFDFDRGMTLNVVREIKGNTPGGGMDLALKAGIDVVAVMGPNEGGLLGVATVFEKLGPGTWESVHPGDLRIVAEKQWRIDRQQKVTSGDTESSYPVYAFKTFQGGLGIVQLLGVDKQNLTVKFRYAMLSEGSAGETPTERRAESAQVLKEMGLAMAMYANDHQGGFPDALEQLKAYLDKVVDFQWVLDDFEYLGKGTRAGDSPPAEIAFHKSLLREGKGTNVLFSDGHVEFVTADEFKKRGILAEIVRKAVLTISTCTESDPRVAESLDSLKPFKDGPAINELCKYLDSDTATVRRSAIFILWRGGFKDIAPAEEKLIKLCGHEENLTRGMSLLALGAGKVAAGYDILADKTVNGSDGYVRRCAAYALGLYGDKKAVPVLEKALQDKDELVKNNAQAAITMLTEPKDSEQK